MESGADGDRRPALHRAQAALRRMPAGRVLPGQGGGGPSGWPQQERKTPSFRYEDSNRYYRGKVLAELREISYAGTEGIDLRELGRRVRPDFDEREISWLHAAVESLRKDGLAKISSGSGAAVMPDAVAEEPSRYGVGPDRLSLEQRVSLP